jgi:flagellar motor switch protein FliN
MSQMIESFMQAGAHRPSRAQAHELEEMSIGELLGARESDVLVLQRSVEQPVDLLLEGKVVARGELVAVDGCFAVRITELPLPLKL